MRGAGAGLILLACLAAASAQPLPTAPPESVTVNGVRQAPDEVIAKFVETLTTSSRAGKIARWNQGVCPRTTGLSPKFALYVSWRIRDIAELVGAPLDAAKDCKPNIHVMFIDQPQALLDGVRQKSPAYLGYYDNEAQADALAKVTRPVQSWYVTQTRDLRGALHFDSHSIRGGRMVEVPVCVFPPCDSFQTIKLPEAEVYAVTGTRLGDGLSSVFYHALVVAEPAKLRDIQTGTLADYIAMLALAEIDKPQVCEPLPSILNLLVPDCPQKPTALTAGDAAFLHGLYKITPTTTVHGQRNEVAYQMKQSLKGK
jgi:hypothetical protein